MKIAILVSFVIYITSVAAIESVLTDLRFPVDSRIIQATLNKDNITHLLYDLEKNNTVVNYYIVNTKYSCGPNKIEIDDNYTFAQYFHILPLNYDKVFLVPIAYDAKFKKYPVKMEIINLLSCQRTKVVLPTKIKPSDLKITRYADSFDIYFNDSSSDGMGYRRTSYDFQGNIISIPIIEFHSNKSVPTVKPIGSELRSKRYLAFESTKEKTIVNLVNSEKIKVLAEIADTMFTPEVSTTNNIISIAYRLDFTNIKLIRYDLDGNLKSETLIEYDHIIRTARILNSSNGGIYILATECDRDHCNDEQNVYSIKKFDANGKEVGSKLLALPTPGIIEDLSFYESKGSHCLTRAQLSLGVSGLWQFKKLDIITKCLSDEDFT